MPVYLRRIIFWLFVVSFFVIGPLLVLYTAGYRLNLKNGHVIRTGVISISSAPRSASILLDGEDTQEKTTHVFKQLLPAKYTVGLEKESYIPWEGIVEVESGQTVSLQNIILFLDSEAENHFNRDIQSLSVHPSGGLLAYLVQQSGWSELWLYDLASREHQLISQSISVTDAVEPELLWSASGGYLALFQEGIEPNVYTASGEILDITITAPDVSDITWHPSTDHVLYIRTINGIAQHDLISGDSAKIQETDADSISLDASILSLADNGSQTEVQQIIDGEKTVLALLPSDEYTLLMRDGSFLLLRNDRDEIFLLEIHSDEPLLLRRKATSYDWLSEQNLLVYSDGTEVNIFNAYTNETTFLTRQSLVIESVLWHPIGQHIVVQDTADIQTYEYKYVAEDRFITTLLDDIDVEQWWMDDAGETLYLYGEKDGASGFYQRPLMEDTILFDL
ncbi:PEGA domain-containing protein [Candidatus Uhrbacteria bacterium]|jgi:hypothetical protein|nr:PEGA domain-containing protein [Candidatus Uhrbacteria bacterium]